MRDLKLFCKGMGQPAYKVLYYKLQALGIKNFETLMSTPLEYLEAHLTMTELQFIKDGTTMTEGHRNLFAAIIRSALEDYQNHKKATKMEDIMAFDSAKEFLFREEGLETWLAASGLDINVDYIREQAENGELLCKAKRPKL